MDQASRSEHSEYHVYRDSVASSDYALVVSMFQSLLVERDAFNP